MTELKRIGVLSAAKMFAVLSLIGGIVLAVLAVAALSLVPAALSSTVFMRSPVMGFFAGLGALLLVVIPVLAVVFGFVIGAVEAAFYNIIAERVGGARLKLAGGTIGSFEPVSTARIVALIAGIVTILTFIVIAPFSALLGGGIGALVTLGLGVLETLVVMLIEFVLFIIVVVVYNFLARKVGGVRIGIKANALRRIEHVPFAKIYGIFAAILGLFYGIIFALVVVFVPAPSLHAGLFGILGALAIVVFPVLGFILGFVYGEVYALVYNAIASRIGGIRLYFRG